jgi:peptidoglycan hydrolase-like protein with peptidoglycan-binding domain
MKRLIVGLLITLFMARVVVAQETVWLQIEAQPNLNTATNSASQYSSNLQDVNGFGLGSGWYGIVLGPYARADAEALRRQLIRDRLIPRDAFVAEGNNFRQQFWPVGASTLNNAAQSTDTTEPAETTGETVQVVVEPVEEIFTLVIAVPDETRREALASEQLLSREDKKYLQIALQWEGIYSAAIDGSFGRGTRSSMRAWQENNDHEPTGVLTTGQRVELLAAYNAVLEGMNLRIVRDDIIGIRMAVPTGIMEIDAYEPPFARYLPTGEFGASLYKISQEGDQNTLFGFYEILQTLETVPTEGPRQRRNESFELEGIDDEFHTYATATLSGGQIKGFMLVWPAGDEDRRVRVLNEMKSTFERIDGVLDPAMGEPGEDQAIDLISGLEVRKPSLSRSGFYIDNRGTVLTTAEAVGSCARITLDQDHTAEIVMIDADLGIAVLKPNTVLAPGSVATFQSRVPRLQAEISVAGFPYQGVLTAPSLTFGKLADIRGLNGEDTIKRLALTAQAGDAGGPVFDTTGAVLGMLLPKSANEGQQLPPQVSFIADSDAILASLSEASIALRSDAVVTSMTPEMLTLAAQQMTVLVSCWTE